MHTPFIHWSKTFHDYLAAAVTGGALGLSFTSVEAGLKVAALGLAIVFTIQGIIMRHAKMRYYAKQKKDQEKKDRPDSAGKT
jgi:predicted histidine transporter YuiF (NhaC family)